MTSVELHQLALRLHENAQDEDALRILRDILGEDSFIWNDWATIHFRRGNLDEAEAGFRLALQLNPEDVHAATNLGALLIDQERFGEALPFLELGRSTSDSSEQMALQQLLVFAHDRLQVSPGQDSIALETFLRESLSDDADEIVYFNKHVRRFVSTLQTLPTATNGARLLELGSAFPPLWAALKHCKRYENIRGTDVWQSSLHESWTRSSRPDKSVVKFEVDNFPLELMPWPYSPDQFDVVLCCHILEHLHSDPMALLQEINRILKLNGILLLTTPNLASAAAVERALAGTTPYCDGKFKIHGRPTDRHNREYVAPEVGRLSVHAGFEIVSLKTCDCYSRPGNDTLIRLGRNGFPLALRGDSTLLLARKVQPVRERYPEEFYDTRTARPVALPYSSAPSSKVAAEKPQSPLKVLLVHEIVPQHDCSGADLRLFELVRELLHDRHQVTVLARMDRGAERYAPDLEALGAKVVAGDPERLKHFGEDRVTSWNLQEFLTSGQFDVAILSFWFWNQISVAEHYLDDIRQWSPDTCVMILSEDRHGERERRAYQLSAFLSDLERGENFEQREIEVYQQADLLLYVSEADHRHFRSLLPNLRAEHLPTLAEATPHSASFADRDGLLFLGNFENLANRDALHWLLEKVLPILQRKEPALVLYVAGNALTPELCPTTKSVVNLGKLADLGSEFAKRRVFLGSIRYGTGIITKNMIAMAHGLPVVTTSVGAEGLQLVDGEHAVIANEPESFAAGILRLYRDECYWAKISDGGRNYIASNFNVENLRKQLRKIMQMVPSLPRKLFDRDHQWSYRKVEQHLPQVLTQRPIHYRAHLRQLGYWQLGSRFLAEQKYSQALEQFRHVFATLRGQIPSTVFHTRLLEDMALCYEGLKIDNSASLCRAELQKLSDSAPWPSHAKQSAKALSSGPGDKLELSVIVPTCNRKEILRLCLTALSLQTLPSRYWEVVVIVDGSSDGTGTMLESSAFPFGAIRIISQTNRGAGAARRTGVAAARGKFVLFLNDDSVADLTLLEQHLSGHKGGDQERTAILGAFVPTEECHRHALSLWVQRSTFLFPQKLLRPGQFYDASHFITCNLSILRSAVLEVGSFDPQFRVGEDTELGTRLASKGIRVKYHPAASAWHEHSSFTTADLLNRARAYAPAYAALFRKHPKLLQGGKTPFGTLSSEDFARIETHVKEKSSAVKAAIAALEALDSVDLFALSQKNELTASSLQVVMDKLTQLVPLVYWHTLFESFLKITENSKTTIGPVSETELVRSAQ